MNLKSYSFFAGNIPQLYSDTHDNMKTYEYKELDAVDLANLINDKQVTPGELMALAQELTELKNEPVNAIVQTFWELADQQLNDLAEGPFAGIPFVIKNLNQQLSGTVTTNSSRLFLNESSDQDTTLVTRYKSAGLAIFGKTNTPEFGLATTTEPQLHGPTKNPWNLLYSPGGSSGGAAAAVASGIVPMANASDGGGSIRIPASCCGLFGLKPTRGRVPIGPFAMEGWGGLSTSHAITKTVRDSALLLDCTQGPEPGSPYHAPNLDSSFFETHAIEPGKCRIALCIDTFNGATHDPEVVEITRKAAKILEDLGHTTEETKLPINQELVRSAHGIIAVCHIGSTVEKMAKKLDLVITEEHLERVTWNNYLSAQEISGPDYAGAVGDIHQMGRIVSEFFKDFDLILSPSLACAPPKIGALDTMSEDTDSYLSLLYQMIGYTSLFNDTGHPACSLPLGLNSEGLPIGSQLVASFGNEKLLFQIASQVERAGYFQPILPLKD